jgi:hypothetical protein
MTKTKSKMESKISVILNFNDLFITKLTKINPIKSILHLSYNFRFLYQNLTQIIHHSSITALFAFGIF